MWCFTPLHIVNAEGWYMRIVAWKARYLGALMLAVGFAVIAGLPSEVRTAEAQTPGAGLIGLTKDNRLVRFSPSDPSRLLGSVQITGVVFGEQLLGIDYRPATGQLYALSSFDKLYTINATTGVASQVAVASGTLVDGGLLGGEFGFDFNPVPDRIRVVSDTRQNLRLNPVTGALAATDGRLIYAFDDVFEGITPRVVGAAYTNSVAGATTTTNYAIDAATNALVTQGSLNGSPVSPNTGQLFTVGTLGVAPVGPVGFDIAPNGTAYAAMIPDGYQVSELYTINLSTGRASRIGTIGSGFVIIGLAVMP